MHGFGQKNSNKWTAMVMNQLPSRRSLVEIVENDLPRFVEDSLQNMQFDTVYFGADSIDPMHGLSTFNEEEAP
jgi:hypothetical protein